MLIKTLHQKLNQQSHYPIDSLNSHVHNNISFCIQDGGTHEYVVVFGGYGNTMSDIRRIPDDTDTIKAQASTTSICDCNNYKPFWVQWLDDGSISAGTGEDVGRNFYLAIWLAKSLNQ